MPRGRPRGSTARGRASARRATKSTPSISIRGRGRSKCGINVTKSKSTKTTKSKENRRAWDESDDEYYDRPDYYTDSSDEFDSDTSTARRSFTEDDAVDEELEETSSSSSNIPSGASFYENDECIECPWLDISLEQLPTMNLPEGSKDLLLSASHVFDALEVYETCRWYYQAIRLSPFLFEDFCFALSTEGQTNLLAEIHIALLKLALKDDDDEGIILSVQDTNNSFNIMLQLLEPMTYAEVLRQYLESDPQRFPAKVLEAASGNYPFVDVRRRLIVLSWLCDRFLQSNEYRNIVRNEGKLMADEHCRECGKPGDVLLCDGCEACYHLPCTNLTDVPDGKWLCQVCELHKVRGVTDCDVTGYRSHRMPMRFKPLGYDRHGRCYWFTARRIFVHDDRDGSVHYYSTLPQLYALLNHLSVKDYEKNLAAVFMDLLPTIDAHMRITLQLSTEYGRSAKTRNKTDLYLHADNVLRMGEILAKPLYSQLRESDDERVVVALGNLKRVEVSKYLLLCKVEGLLGFVDNCLRDTFWTAGMQTHEVISKKDVVEVSFATASLSGNASEVVSAELGFRLGEGDTLSRYINQYSVNEYAKNPIQRAKERDKKKYMSGRFSLMDDGEFEWTVTKGRSLSGTQNQIGEIIQNTLESFAQKIPPVLMHRLWKRDGLDYFKKGLTVSPSVELMKDLLLRFECAIRRSVFHSVWWNSLGHTRLMRITVEDRERRLHYEAKKKKQERELLAAEQDDEEVIWVKHLKVGSVIKRTLWRQNDESYRVNGRGALGGWLWVSKTFHRSFLPKAEKPTTDTELKPTTLANQKAIRLEKVIKRLNEWRNAEYEREERKWQKELLKDCYSPMCKMGIMPLEITSGSNGVQSCYSMICRQAVIQSMGRTTSCVVRARPQSPSSKCLQENGNSEKLLGSTKPYPLPLPFQYRVRRTGEQSILVLPQMALKRLARQGGVNFNYFAPGFHRMAKSNNQVWNYPCQRPLFDNCWRYLVLRAQSYHSIALHLRILYACIRWADMRRGPDEDSRVTVHLADHDEVRSVIGHKEFPPDGMFEQYKLRIELIPLDDNVDLDEDDEGLGSAAYHPSKSLDKTLRKRKAIKGKQGNGTLRRDHVKVLERWIDGVELKPWEIVDYWKGIENRVKRSGGASALVTVDNRVSTPVNRTYEPPPAFGRASVEKRRPQPKRMPDYDYDVKDKLDGDEDDGEIDSDDDDDEDGNGNDDDDDNDNDDDDDDDDEDDDDDDDEYIDVETLPKVSRAKPISSTASKPKIPRLSGLGSEKQFSEREQWQNPNREHVQLHRQHEQVARQPGELLGGGKYTMLKKPDGTVCRVMVYQNRQAPGSAGSSVRSPTSLGSQSTGIRESVRVPVARRIVSLPGSSQASPVAPMGKRLVLIRRSNGTTQYARPVSQSNSSGAGALTACRMIRTTQGAGATVNDIRSVPGSSLARPGGTIRTVFSGNQSMGRFVRLPARTFTLVNHSPAPGSHPSQVPTMRFARLQPVVRRGVEGDDVQSNQYTSSSHEQMEEEYRLSTDSNIRSPGRSSGTLLSSGSGHAVNTGRPAVTVQPRQGLAAVVHPSREQQASSGQVFGDHDPMVGTGLCTPGRYSNLVRSAGSRGILVRSRFSGERDRGEHHGRGGLSLYGRIQTSRLNDLADAASAVGHNYASSRILMKHNGTLDIRSNLFIRPFEHADLKVIKEVLDDLISEVCRMDAEYGWHRFHVQRAFERRQEERKRRELQQRALKIQRLSVRQLEAELGVRTLYKPPNVQLQSIAGMPVEPSNISLGGITHVNEAVVDKGDESSTVRLPSVGDDKYQKAAGLIPDLSAQKPHSVSLSNQPLSISPTAEQAEDTLQQRRSERSKKRKNWDNDYVSIERRRSASRMSSGSETATVSSRGKRTRKEQRQTSCGTSTSVLPRPGTASSGSVPDIDTTKRHCKCNQPYDPKKFYVGCDLCYRWFHGRCVGISEKKSKKMTSWVCDDCAKEQKSSEQELYCVCQTPYDDTRFYVGCDGCEGWFHPQCVGITQEEAENEAEYLCPQCVQKKRANHESNDSLYSQTTLSRTDFALLWQLFDHLKDHRTSWPFKKAVDPKEHPDYYSIIDKPMDLSIVKQRLERCNYNRLKDFTADVTQIFENARIYNPKDSAIYQCADILEKYFRERVLEVKSVLEMKNREQSMISRDN